MNIFHKHSCFNFDRKSNLEINKRRKLNQDITNLFNSTKIRMNNTLLHKFRAFSYKNHDKIDQMNRDAKRSKGCSIQRIEYLEYNTLFDEIKNSITVQEQTFMTGFNKSIYFPAGYNVRGYLTWSLTHKIYPPSITTLNINESICKEGDIGYPHTICFFSLEENYDYYFQLWNKSDENSNPETLTEEKLCWIPTDFLRTFSGDVVHYGGFKSLN